MSILERSLVTFLTALTTTILEIGPEKLTHQHTGRAIVVPNSVFLDKHVVNESYTADFVLHVFRLPYKTLVCCRPFSTAFSA